MPFPAHGEHGNVAGDGPGRAVCPAPVGQRVEPDQAADGGAQPGQEGDRLLDPMAVEAAPGRTGVTDDHDQRALNLDGQRIPLTPLEFKLVAYLEGLDGAPATRDQILDDVWGSFESAGSSNVVDAVVKSLRRKMGDQASRIETIRGFGYRWRLS